MSSPAFRHLAYLVNRTDFKALPIFNNRIRRFTKERAALAIALYDFYNHSIPEIGEAMKLAISGIHAKVNIQSIYRADPVVRDYLRELEAIAKNRSYGKYRGKLITLEEVGRWLEPKTERTDYARLRTL